MTENKRFTTDTPNSLSEIYDDGRILTNGEVIKYINWYREDMRNFSVENEQLKSKLEESKKAHSRCDKLWWELHDEKEQLEKENVQLKQRNNRQAKQLDRLYNLIEQKDWRALNDILDDFKKCDEQLQKEWGTYGDVE